MALTNNNNQAVALIDSHCHLDLLPQPKQLWQQCQQQAIKQLIIPATRSSSWPTICQLSSTLEGVFYSAGIHPWWAKDGLDSEALAKQLGQEKCIALGECGLDKYKDHWPQQLSLCQQQIQLAAELQHPLILHCVKAHNELIELLKRYQPKAGGVIHAFSGSLELAQQYINLGFCLGIGATISYPRAKKTIDTVRQLPSYTLLLETDAPSMPLHGQQGQENSPLQLTIIAEILAQLRGQPVQELATICNNNCHRVFPRLA